MRRLLAGVVAASTLVGGTAHTEDWPEFRGPSGQGHSAERHLPVEWSSTRNVAWKQSVPGHSWSSPVLRNGRLYLTTALDRDGDAGLSLRALCLNAATGEFLWNTEIFALPADRIHTKNSHASPTPLLAGDRLYVHFGHQGTACLDLAGRVLWRNNEIKYQPVHGSGGSPILVDELLVFSCDGASDPFVVALDKGNGKIRWKVRRESDAQKKFAFSTPLLIEVNGRKQIVSPGSNAVCAYDPTDGREIWRVRYDGYSVIPRPVYGHGLVYLSSGFDRPVALAIRADGAGDVTDSHVAWQAAKSAPNTPSPLLVGDELYLVSDGGIASCLDARTGRVHWQERVGGNYSASPLYAEGRIYLQNEEGVGVVIKAGREFQVLARNALNERTLASYAAGDSALFIRTAEHLYRVQQ